MHRMPAFIDSHAHFLGIGYYASMIDLEPADSIEALIRLSRRPTAAPMIVGRGWNQEQLQEKRMPVKADLNRISTAKPVVMIRACGHVLCVNDRMLELAGITPNTAFSGAGTMSFETGIFTEDALNLIYSAYPVPSREELKNYLVAANRIFLAHGITSVASDDFLTFPVPFETIIDVIRECHEEDLIQVRITEQANLKNPATLERFIRGGYVNRSFGRLRMGPLKILADGSLGARTAYLNADYSDDPGNRGVATFKAAELNRLVHAADAAGMDVVIHAIGDGAADMALDALEVSLAKTGRSDHRHAIIHAQMTTRAQIARMKRARIGAVVQPIFLNTDIAMLTSRIGERRSESYLFHSMRNAGIPVGFSSDGPVETVDPFANLYCAVARTSIKDPAVGVFLPEEAFTVAEALDCYTVANRRFTYAEPNRDEILVTSDPCDVATSAIKDIRVLETAVDGRIVYRRK